LANVKTEYLKCCQAKELLNLEPGNPARILEIEEETNNFKELWTELDRAWKNVEEIKDNLFASVQEKKIRESTEKANALLAELPIKMKTYEPYRQIKDKVNLYKKINEAVLSLKVEAMKPRHWKTLQKTLKLTNSYENLTLQ
jgi:dynein heavy chain 1, cytosolic